MYRANEAELGFRYPLPGEQVRVARPGGSEDGDVDRRGFLRGAAVVAVGAAVHHVPFAGSSKAGPAERECVQRLALLMSERHVAALHPAELPCDVAEQLSAVVRTSPAATTPTAAVHSFLHWDEQGRLTFEHRSLIDFFVAQAMFADIFSGKARLARTQTSHETDLLVKDYLLVAPDRVPTLRRWMVGDAGAVLRVNSAGILAKLGDPVLADEVIAILRGDEQLCARYLTAVISRVLAVEWQQATGLAAELHRAEMGPSAPSGGQAAAMASTFAVEVRNPRDAAARWCATLVLSCVRDAAPQQVSEALNDALVEETSREALRAIGQALAGGDPAAA